MEFDIRSRCRDLMHLEYIKESSIFREVVALSKKDIEFLQEFGVILYEGFQRNSVEQSDRWKYLIDRFFWDASVCSIFQRHSQQALKSFEKFYWVGDSRQNVGSWFVVGSISDQICLRLQKTGQTSGVLWSTTLQPKHIFLYFPLVADFVLYYMRENKHKESEERLYILKYVSQILEDIRPRKYILYYVDRISLVDEI